MKRTKIMKPRAPWRQRRKRASLVREANKLLRVARRQAEHDSNVKYYPVSHSRYQ